MQQAEGESSHAVRSRVTTARRLQDRRQGKPNSELAIRDIDRLCATEAAATTLLRQAIVRLNLSARAYHRVLKIARTVADLAGDSRIGVSHVAEAIQYRRLDSHSR